MEDVEEMQVQVAADGNASGEGVHFFRIRGRHESTSPNFGKAALHEKQFHVRIDVNGARRYEGTELLCYSTLAHSPDSVSFLHHAQRYHCSSMGWLKKSETDRRSESLDEDEEARTGLIDSTSVKAVQSVPKKNLQIFYSSLIAVLILTNLAWAVVCLVLWHYSTLAASCTNRQFSADFGMLMFAITAIGE